LTSPEELEEDGDMIQPEIPRNRIDDLHNLEQVEDADLLLFMAGNQFMVMEELVAAFREEHPEVERIFYETLPPGLELQQILAGGARFRDRIIRGDADIYTSVTEEAMLELVRAEFAREYRVYLHNRIVLMVPRGNPARIRSVQDLGRAKVRISQPGHLEDISRHAAAMYRDAGGEALAQRILEEKREEGTTILTVVHHRETPLRLSKGTVDVGPVWATEVVHAREQGYEVKAVEPGPELDQRERVNYYATKLAGSPNLRNAGLFFRFLFSERAREVYRSYGFLPSRDVG
jgi:ABC-type molybdate transport system substrate-binding protein